MAPEIANCSIFSNFSRRTFQTPLHTLPFKVSRQLCYLQSCFYTG